MHALDDGAPGLPGVRFCAGFRDRMRGLIGRGRGYLPDGSVLCIAPCDGIHTFLMREPIDYAFASREGRVLAAGRGLGPRRVRLCPGASFALERFASDAPWLRENDRLDMMLGIVPSEGRQP